MQIGNNEADTMRKTFNCLHIDDSCGNSENATVAFVGLNELMEDVIAGRETLDGFDNAEDGDNHQIELGFDVDDLAATFFT